MALDFFKPVSNITPFTYRDGETYLGQLKRLRNWIDEVAELSNEQIKAVIDTFDAGMADAMRTVLAAQTAANASANAANNSAASAAEARILAESMVTLQDNEVTDFIANPNSATGAAVRKQARTPFPEGLSGTRFYDLSTGIYGNRSYIPSSKLVIEKTRIAGNGLGRIACIGHSNVSGAGPTVHGVSAWPDMMRDILAYRGHITAGTGVVTANINSSPERDFRWTFSAGWALFAPNSPAVVSKSAGQTATFVSNMPGTIVDIYTYDTTTAMSVKIDGVAVADIVGAMVNNTMAKKYSYSGLSNTAHTVEITSKTASDCYIVGIEVRNNDGLSVSNLGIGGATMNQWASNAYYHHAGIFRAIAPTLTFIQCQVNDAKQGTPAASWRGYAKQTIDFAKESGVAVMVIDPTPRFDAAGPYPAIPESLWMQYRQAAIDVADETASILIDLSEIYGDFSLSSGAGWMFDSVHPTYFGAQIIARVAASIITTP